MSNDSTNIMTVPLSAELLRQFGNVALFASKDKARPILTCLNVEQIEQGGRRGVAIVATDTYVLAWAEVFPTEPADAPSGMLDVNLPVDAVKTIATMVKGSGLERHPEAFALDLAECGWSLVRRDGSGTLASGETPAGQFPAWRSLIPGAFPRGPETPRLTVDMNLFGRVTKFKLSPDAESKKSTVRTWASPDENKLSVWYHVTADVSGLIMPVRVGAEVANAFPSPSAKVAQ